MARKRLLHEIVRADAVGIELLGGVLVAEARIELDDNVVESMTSKELSDKIKKEKIRGSGVMNDLLFEQYKRFIQPLSAFVLTLIGVALSSRKVRGGVGLPLGIGIVLSFLFIVLNQFAKMFSTKGGLPPLVANLLPVIIFAILGLYLLRRAPK